MLQNPCLWSGDPGGSIPWALWYLVTHWQARIPCFWSSLADWNSGNLTPSLSEVASSWGLQSLREGARAVLVLRPKPAFRAQEGHDALQLPAPPPRQRGLQPVRRSSAGGAGGTRPRAQAQLGLPVTAGGTVHDDGLLPRTPVLFSSGSLVFRFLAVAASYRG